VQSIIHVYVSRQSHETYILYRAIATIYGQYKVTFILFFQLYATCTLLQRPLCTLPVKHCLQVKCCEQPTRKVLSAIYM